MYAFGLVETNFYNEAEKHAKQVQGKNCETSLLFITVHPFLYSKVDKILDSSSSMQGLDLNPYDCWSTHALCHVLEMEGRYAEGVKFLKNTENYWTVSILLMLQSFKYM